MNVTRVRPLQRTEWRQGTKGYGTRVETWPAVYARHQPRGKKGHFAHEGPSSLANEKHTAAPKEVVELMPSWRRFSVDKHVVSFYLVRTSGRQNA